MEEELTFLPLLIVVFLAFIVPITLSRFRRLRLPIVVGEIIAGIIVGRSGLGWVAQHDVVLDLLAEFGFVFLMFLSGMEIDFSSLGLSFNDRRGGNKPRKLGPMSIGSISFGLTISSSLALGFIFYRLDMVSSPLMIALILSTTSLGVVVPVLKEQGLSSGRFGQTLLVSALIADFATMLMITVLVAALSFGITLDILLILVLFLAFFFMVRFGNIFFNRIPGVRRILEELSGATSQIKVRAAFTMMLIFVALSEFLGAEIILGAFLAGAIVSLLRQPEDSDLVHQLDAIGFGFFIPIFFVMVGVDFNLAALMESTQALILVPILLLAAVLVKIIPAFVYRFNFSWRETFGAGILLSARLSLIIAASAIGLRLGVISDSVNSAIILVAIITVAIAPTVFNRIIPKLILERRPIIVVGAGSLGLHVAEQLRDHNEWVIVFDTEDERISRAKGRDFEAYFACVDCQDEAVVPFMDKAKSLVCVYSNVEKNYEVCFNARTTYGIEHVVTRIDVPGELPRFEALGVTTMNAAVDQAYLLAILVRNPDAYELLTRTTDDKEVREVIVRNPAFFGRALSKVDLPGDLLIMALRRDGQLLVPQGNTVLNSGDHLTVVGSLACVEKSRELLNG